MPPSVVIEIKGILGVCLTRKGGSISWKNFEWLLEESEANKNESVTPRAAISVRHPLRRLVSAYRDKYLGGLPIDVYNDTYRKKIDAKEPWYKATFSFEQFINHVLWTHELKLPDIHWLPIFNTCHPCFYHYDYVIHLETVKEDVRDLLSLTHIQDPDKYPFPTRPDTSLRKAPVLTPPTMPTFHHM
ncbi:hypothetical protein Pmani_006617 [Petrolisthes manimaculis]|uniref:Carbohydrate sulfotransferase n=1 Tax=Petrolisthes manimaculis TaxID=1843537 RepID=A0AAE1UKX8_9EUCA|nr:hypothetical protein Pmani_006617 [Petrolisthes manimaculis]